MINFFKKPSVIVFVAVLIVVLFVGYRYFFGEKESSYEIAQAKRSDISQEVSLTGRVKPSEEVSLAFEKSGRIGSVNVKIGDKVIAWETLLTLDDSEIAAQLAQAEANAESAESKLEELKIGTREEEIKLTETKVLSAQKSLIDAKNYFENTKTKADNDLQNLYADVDNILNDSYIKTDDAINKQIDEMFYDDQSSNPRLTFLTANSQAKSDSEWGRLSSGMELTKIKIIIDGLTTNYSDLDLALSNAKNSIIVIRDFFYKLNDAVNGATSISQAMITLYKGYINTGRANISTALSNITSQEQLIAAQKITNQNNISSAQSQVNSAENALKLAEDELALKKAGSTSQQISFQESQVKQAKANVLNYKAQLDKLKIVSPIDGVATKQDAKVGQIASVNVPVVSVINDRKFEIEVNIPEADIAKVKIGNLARVTLDAYGNDEVFEAKVVSIDPGGTILEGIATYKTTLQFTREDSLLKSELTANIDIVTAQSKNAVNVLQRSIFTENEEKFVKVLESDGVTTKDVRVETGIRGINGEIEILSGISEGDKIVISL